MSKFDAAKKEGGFDKFNILVTDVFNKGVSRGEFISELRKLAPQPSAEKYSKIFIAALFGPDAEKTALGIQAVLEAGKKEGSTASDVVAAAKDKFPERLTPSAKELEQISKEGSGREAAVNLLAALTRISREKNELDVSGLILGKDLRADLNGLK